MKSELSVRNQQRARPINLHYLNRIIRALLESTPEHLLGIHLVDQKKMARINETYLRHKGSTDVITFDYRDPAQPKILAGDIFVCVAEAVEQARLFHTTWQAEVARYIVHGVLHLRGYDDRKVKERKRMKRAEDKLVKDLGAKFDFRKIARTQQRFDNVGVV
jgi:probable rRNA maturation factor